MEEKDCWDKFAVSGKVEDYLKYRSSVGDAAHNKADSTQTAAIKQEAAPASGYSAGSAGIWRLD